MGIKKTTLLTELYCECDESEKVILTKLKENYLGEMPNVASLAPDLLVPRTLNIAKHETEWTMWTGNSNVPSSGYRPPRDHHEEEFDDHHDGRFGEDDEAYAEREEVFYKSFYI